jgi:hypothetical protein
VQINVADYEPEIEDLMDPKDVLKKKIVAVASTIRDWHNETTRAQKSVREQLQTILDLGLNSYKMQKTDLRELIEGIFLYHGISGSWLRKLLPEGLKDTSKTRLSYLQRQKIEKDRQRLLHQQASESRQELETSEFGVSSDSTEKPDSYQPTELEPIVSPSVDMQGLGIQYIGNNSLAQAEDSSLPKKSVTIQNELSEANKRIERLQEDMRSLSKPFVAKASLQAADQDIPLVAKIDPVKKSITSIQIDKSY